MKYLPLLLANLKRKKIRTLLTIGSFVVALFLFGVLAAIRAGFSQGIDVAGADRLIVMGKISLMQLLPSTYLYRIARLPGVQSVAQLTRLERGLALALEELPLPGVEDGGLELMLVAGVGDGHLVDEVASEDGDLLGRSVILAGLAHRVFLASGAMLTLARENSDSS